MASAPRPAPTLQEGPSSRQPVPPFPSPPCVSPCDRPALLEASCPRGVTGDPQGRESDRRARRPSMAATAGGQGQERRAGPGPALCQREPQPQGAGGTAGAWPGARRRAQGVTRPPPRWQGGAGLTVPAAGLHGPRQPLQKLSSLVFVRAGPRQQPAGAAGKLGEAGAGMCAGPAARPASRRCLPPGLWEPGGHTCWRPGAEIGRP